MAFSLHPLRENMNAPRKIAAIQGYSRRKPFVTRGNFLHFHIRMRIQQPCDDLFVLLYRKRTGRVQQLSALCKHLIRLLDQFFLDRHIMLRPIFTVVAQH